MTLDFSIREVKIKTTLRYHRTSVRVAVNQEMWQQMLQRMWRERWGLFTVCGVQISMTIMEITLEITQKIKNGATISPNYFTPGNTPRELHTLPQRYLYSYVYCGFVHYTKEIEPTDE